MCSLCPGHGHVGVCGMPFVSQRFLYSERQQPEPAPTRAHGDTCAFPSAAGFPKLTPLETDFRLRSEKNTNLHIKTTANRKTKDLSQSTGKGAAVWAARAGGTGINHQHQVPHRESERGFHAVGRINVNSWKRLQKFRRAKGTAQTKQIKKQSKYLKGSTLQRHRG